MEVYISRTIRRRERVSILVAVEAGQHHPVSVLVHHVGTRQFHGAGSRATEEDHVRYRSVLHHVVHDQCRFRERRLRDGQREDIHDMHDGHCV